jgi:tetratricopeptide (TPR) repeat protein
MMKWIERYRPGCPDSIFVKEMDVRYRELKVFKDSRLNYALMDKQIIQISNILDKSYEECNERVSPEGIIRKEILARTPDDADRLILDGIQLRDSDKHEQAYGHFIKAVEKAPLRLSYYYFTITEELNFKQDTVKALEYLDRVIKLSKGKQMSVFQPYLMRAWIYTSQENYKAAVDDCNSELENNANSIQALYYRAYVKSEMHDYAGAVADYKEVLKSLRLRPFAGVTDSARVLNTIGWNYYLIKDYTLCVEYADKSLLLDPDNSRTLDTRGSGYFGLGNYEKCIDDMTKAIGFEPELANSWYLRGLSWLKLDRKEQACADLTQAADLGYTEAIDSKKGLCPPPVNREIQEQRKFPRSKSTNKNRFGINPYTMFYRLN